MGNPPYVRQEQLGEDKKFLELNYEVYHGVADLYVYFFECGHRLLKQKGQFGFISSNKFMRSNYGTALRRYFKEKTYIREILDFGDLPVFAEATTYPAIILTENAPRNGQVTLYTKILNLEFKSLREVVVKEAIALPETAFEDHSWSLVGSDEQAILHKTGSLGISLGEYVNNVIKRGVLTGYNEAFIIDKVTSDNLIREDPKSKEIIKPLVVGEDPKRYEIDYKDKYLIFTRRGIEIDAYPVIKKHLEKYRARLEPRPKDWDETISGKWQGRKPGPYQWYEIQDSTKYYNDFEKQYLRH